jgi:hypothetical protein
MTVGLTNGMKNKAQHTTAIWNMTSFGLNLKLVLSF